MKWQRLVQFKIISSLEVLSSLYFGIKNVYFFMSRSIATQHRSYQKPTPPLEVDRAGGDKFLTLSENKFSLKEQKSGSVVINLTKIVV